jgi:hypothetical protein
LPINYRASGRVLSKSLKAYLCPAAGRVWEAPTSLCGRELIGIKEAQNISAAACYASVERRRLAENDFARMVGGPPPESLSGSPGSQHYRLPGPRSDHNCSIDENAGRRRGHHGIVCDIVGLHRLGWRVSAHTRHLFHSSVPSFKREPRTAIVADGPKARDENLTR